MDERIVVSLRTAADVEPNLGTAIDAGFKVGDNDVAHVDRSRRQRERVDKLRMTPLLWSASSNLGDSRSK